jgi:hypothetical protein
MTQNRKQPNILATILNLSFVALASAILLPDCQKIQAQSGIQVRTNQWLQVSQVTGTVTYRNLYNYANRQAKIGDRLEVVSDEISTGENSSAILTVDTAVGSIYVTENTTIKIPLRSPQIMVGLPIYLSRVVKRDCKFVNSPIAALS